MVEQKGVDAGLRLEARAYVAAFDGVLFAGLQFQVGQPFQGGGHAEIPGGRDSQRRLHRAAHSGEGQLIQFLFEGRHQVPFQSRE